MLLGWLWAFAAAAQSSFSQDMRGYDVESLIWAAIMSLFGGALRTIFTLATDASMVTSILREAVKDSAVAIIAGVVAYIGIEAIRAAGWLPVPSEVRFAMIVFAGWSRLGFFKTLNDFGTRATEAFIKRVEGAVAGGGVAVTPPPPPSPKPKPFQEKP